MGDVFTMDAMKAAELVNKIRPDVAMTVHYGTIVGEFEGWIDTCRGREESGKGHIRADIIYTSITTSTGFDKKAEYMIISLKHIDKSNNNL